MNCQHVLWRLGGTEYSKYGNKRQQRNVKCAAFLSQTSIEINSTSDANTSTRVQVQMRLLSVIDSPTALILLKTNMSLQVRQLN